LLARRVPALQDRPRAETDEINAASRRYFERAHGREYWLNRPLSDRPPDPTALWRFGLIVAALRLQPGSRVLDFGCGTGWTSSLLARMGLDVVGLDIAPSALELAREVAERDLAHSPDARLRFEVYGGASIAAPDGHFDAVLVYDAFHHLPNPRELLGEFHRVLGPHGRLAFAEPGVGHAECEESRAEREHGVLEEDIDIVQLDTTARAAGFSDLDVLVPPLPPDVLTLPMSRLRLYMRGASWLVPADFVRREILVRPMGVFRKGPWAITSLAPGAQGARIRPRPRTLRVKAGDICRIDADLVNTAETVWLREGRHGRGYVRLGAQLLDSEGETLARDYARAELPYDVPEGGLVTVTLEAPAPADAGRYILRLDLVNEGVGWFGASGSDVVDVGLEVDRA
jgi:SAM-dependent methyltransferase